MHDQITLYKQIYPSQCPALANLGYKSLIDLRFDDESQNQPNSDAISNSALASGLVYHHLPVSGDHLSNDVVQHFAKLITHLPKPVMVFCHSGSRAKRLYQSALISGLI